VYNLPRPHFPRLEKDIQTQVTVIGGGITGLTTAYLLSKEGKKVALVEDGEIASGESGRTTAHLMSELDDKYLVLKKMFGVEGAKLAADSQKASIDMMEKIVKEEKIDCEFMRLDGYLFLSSSDVLGRGRRFLEDEMAASSEVGMDVKMVDQVPGVDVVGPALKFANQGEIHPLKYLNALANACKKNGVDIYTHTRALQIKGGKEKATTGTNTGNSITSDSVVVATNVPVNDRVIMYSKMAPYRTYVVSFKIPKGSIPKALYWDTDDPYHYVRTSSLDAEHELLIVGGEDHMVGHKYHEEKQFKSLISWTKERFKMAGDVVSKWSGLTDFRMRTASRHLRVAQRATTFIGNWVSVESSGASTHRLSINNFTDFVVLSFAARLRVWVASSWARWWRGWRWTSFFLDDRPEAHVQVFEAIHVEPSSR